MNILVTGANGQLGNELRTIAHNSLDKYIFTDINKSQPDTVVLDITDANAVRDIVSRKRIDIIVNCAAYTNVNRAETDKDLAEKLNGKAPQILASAIKSVNGLLIHISTDYVFGKEPYNRPCQEDQKGTPTGVYGFTKLHGEKNVRSTKCKHVIIRTSWLYSEYGNNFCKTILQKTETEPQIKVVFDQVGTPTYALDLAIAIFSIINDYKKEFKPDHSDAEYSKSGTYHYSNEGVCSWYDFARMIAEYSKHDHLCHILPCHTNEFPSPVQRPYYSVLDKTKIKKTFNLNIPYWTDSLKQCIANIMEEQKTNQTVPKP